MDIPDLEDDFYCVITDEQNEMLLLFKEAPESSRKFEKVIRYAIPLNELESYEVLPIYEDNKPKVSSC